MKFITTRWRMTCAKIKSANPRSGEIPKNWALFCGLDCSRRQTETTSWFIKKIFSIIINKAELTSQHETADGADEPGQERVERKSSNKAAVNKLRDAGQQNVQQVGVHDFQLLGRVVGVLIVELGQHRLDVGHFGESGSWLLGTGMCTKSGWNRRIDVGGSATCKRDT